MTIYDLEQMVNIICPGKTPDVVEVVIPLAAYQKLEKHLSSDVLRSVRFYLKEGTDGKQVLEVLWYGIVYKVSPGEGDTISFTPAVYVGTRL